MYIDAQQQRKVRILSSLHAHRRALTRKLVWCGVVWCGAGFTPSARTPGAPLTPSVGMSGVKEPMSAYKEAITEHPIAEHPSTPQECS